MRDMHAFAAAISGSCGATWAMPSAGVVVVADPDKSAPAATVAPHDADQPDPEQSGQEDDAG